MNEVRESRIEVKFTSGKGRFLMLMKKDQNTRVALESEN